MRCFRSLVVPGVFFLAVSVVHAEGFPPVSELPVQAELPDPLVMLDGSRVKTKA